MQTDREQIVALQRENRALYLETSATFWKSESMRQAQEIRQLHRALRRKTSQIQALTARVSRLKDEIEP